MRHKAQTGRNTGRKIRAGPFLGACIAATALQPLRTLALATPGEMRKIFGRSSRKERQSEAAVSGFLQGMNERTVHPFAERHTVEFVEHGLGETLRAACVELPVCRRCRAGGAAELLEVPD